MCIRDRSSDDTYVASLSSRTIAYKGMFLVDQLRLFFSDLQDKDYESPIALVHSRFSTNTNPSWERAHPNRFIVHNGEINTIRGNRDKMQAREENMESEDLKGELHKVLPAINATGSDSAMLDLSLIHIWKISYFFNCICCRKEVQLTSCRIEEFSVKVQ